MSRAVLIALAFAVLALGGDVSGHIRVTKSLTRKRVSLPQVYERGVALSNPPDAPATTLADELKRVVVYLEGAGLPPGRPVMASMNQLKRRFEPEVVVAPAGSSIAFPNSDPIFHNVFSLSKAKSFDLGNYRMGESRTVKFNEPGVVSVHCHLHPNMAGAIVVTPNGFYAQPGQDGTFNLHGVPAGRYQLVAWHKSAGTFRRTVDVKADGEVSVEFVIPIKDIE